MPNNPNKQRNNETATMSTIMSTDKLKIIDLTIYSIVLVRQ